MPHIDVLLHSNVSPMRHLNYPFQISNSQERRIVFIMDSQFSLQKKIILILNIVCLLFNLKFYDLREAKKFLTSAKASLCS